MTATNEKLRDLRPSATAQRWCGIDDPTDIYLYVLELECSKFYVGLTLDVERRYQRHLEGTGAEWTKQYRPLRLVLKINTGLRNQPEAEALENRVTLELMAKYGKDNVRGGHFAQIADYHVDQAIKGRGAVGELLQHKLKTVGMDLSVSWGDAIDEFLAKALSFYDEGSPEEGSEELFASAFRLSRYAYWRQSHAPCLSTKFWGPKGVLPVLLSFRLGRPVGSKHKFVYDVLASSMMRGRDGRHPHRHLYLKVWQAYTPEVTKNQAPIVAKLLELLEEPEEWDHQFDEIVSILLPETRNLLRQP